MSARILIITVFVLATLVGLHRRHAARLAAADQKVSNEVIQATPDAAIALRSLNQSTTQPVPSPKPWANAVEGISSMPPGKWIVGRCSQAGLSQAEAHLMAQTDAVNVLFPVVEETIEAKGSDAGWLHHRLLADVEQGALQSDSLVEQFQRPYATLWTESLLLDASPEKLAPYVQKYARELRARQARTLIFRTAAAGLIALSWFTYLLLNSITRGYFTTRLRFAAAMITAIVIVAIA
ncbi:MAG: hypothetical protein M3O30_16680 [Planctomycetota bacterium]|nr:hypothetical protein [Planctomycetota bacterium]